MELAEIKLEKNGVKGKLRRYKEGYEGIVKLVGLPQRKENEKVEEAAPGREWVTQKKRGH